MVAGGVNRDRISAAMAYMITSIAFADDSPTEYADQTR